MILINAIPCIASIYAEGMNANLTPGEWLEDQLARPDINLTQQQFGDAVGVGQSTVNGWIQGRARPQRRTCTRIAEVLGISRDDVYAVFGIQRRPGAGISYSEQSIRYDLNEIRRDLVNMRSQLNAIIARIDAAQSDTRIVNHPKE